MTEGEAGEPAREFCDCPPPGKTWYEGKEWTCPKCGTTWRGNALGKDPLIEPVGEK